MSFPGQLHHFSLLCQTRNHDTFVRSVELTHQSVQIGSPITAAPGQPVDTGNLRASWQVQYHSESEAEISTNVAYAPPIEDGVGKYGPLKLRSAVGGFHSVKLTVAGFPRIVDAALQGAKR
jgi:hypothetical protein